MYHIYTKKLSMLRLGLSAQTRIRKQTSALKSECTKHGHLQLLPGLALHHVVPASRCLHIYSSAVLESDVTIRVAELS